MFMYERSYFFDGHDTDKEEGPFEYFSDGFTQDNSAFHVLVTDDSVLLVVLLHLHADLIDEVGDFVDGQFVDGVIEHIVEFDEHGCQVSLFGVGDLEGLLFGESCDLFGSEA